MENKNKNLVDIDDVSCLLAAIPIFTLCDVVCGGKCCAIQSFFGQTRSSVSKENQRISTGIYR